MNVWRVQDWGHLTEVGTGRDVPVPARQQRDDDPDLDVATNSTVVIAFEPKPRPVLAPTAVVAAAQLVGKPESPKKGLVPGLKPAAPKSPPRAVAVPGNTSPIPASNILSGVAHNADGPVPLAVVTNQSDTMTALNATLRSAVAAGRNPLYGSRYFSVVSHPPGSLVEHENRMEVARSQDKFDTMFRMIGHTDLNVSPALVHAVLPHCSLEHRRRRTRGLRGRCGLTLVPSPPTRASVCVVTAADTQAMPKHVREEMIAARQRQKAEAAMIASKSAADIARELKQEQAKKEGAAAVENPYLDMLGQETVHDAPRVSLKGMWRIYLCSESATNFEMPGVSKDSTVRVCTIAHRAACRRLRMSVK